MPRPKNTAARFWAFVDKNGPIPENIPGRPPNLGACWMWTKARDNKGYGVTTIDWKYCRASRAAWFWHTGTMPDKHVLHHCDNPPCCNPAHLFLGTTTDNSANMVTKRRQSYGEKHSQAVLPNRPRGENHSEAKLNEQQVLEIRRLWATTNIPNKTLCEQYGVSKNTLCRVVNGTTWAHLPLTVRDSKVDRKAKLTPETVRAIRGLKATGVTVKALAHQFSLSIFTVNDIVYFRTWKDLPPE